MQGIDNKFSFFQFAHLLFFPDSAMPVGLSFCTSLSLAAIKPLQAQAQLQIRGLIPGVRAGTQKKYLILNALVHRSTSFLEARKELGCQLSRSQV